jgi:uncharacterized protein YhaN
LKILQLHLLAFGPFTEVRLDLSAGDQGLHLIYGPNEAGKTSALRALRQLFYGIPDRTDDAFLHPYHAIRIGARLRHSDGSELEFIRRKGRNNTLRGPDDTAVVAPEELSRFLGGVEAGLFETLFGIDHPRLIAGGREILRGDGHVGQLLFAASSGIADLRSVQSDLHAEMEGLFKPAGRNQKINRTIKEFHDAVTRIKEQQLPAEEWARHDQALRMASERRAALEKDWQDRNREHNRRLRIRAALPAIGQRKEFLARMEECKNAVRLSDDFGDRHREALTALRLAEDRANKARRTLAIIEHQLEPIDVPTVLLDHAEGIEEVYRRLGGYQKNVKDQPQRVFERQQLEADAKELLVALGKPADLAAAGRLRLRADELVVIQNLGNEHQALVGQCRNARELAAQLSGRMKTLQQQVMGLPEVRDPAELRQAIRRAQQAGDLEEQLAAEQQIIEQREGQAAVDVARLPYWAGTLESLEILAAPVPETIDRFDQAFQDCENRLATFAERRVEEEKAVRELDALLRQLDLEHEVPTEEDLRCSRQDREAGWTLVRQAWEDGAEDAPATHAFLEQFPPARNLAEAYEGSVRRSDEVADRLRREAERVTRKIEVRTQQEKHAEQVCHWTQLSSEATAELAQLEAEWSALWEPLGLPAVPPREARAWLRRQADLVDQATELREHRNRSQGLEDRIEGLRTLLRDCLQQGGESAADPSETLASLLERGLKVIERFEEVSQKRRQLKDENDERRRDLLQAEAQVRQSDAELARWQADWAKAMARLDLPAETTPMAANTFLNQTQKLFQHLHEGESLSRRIESMDREARQFAADVEVLVHKAAPNLAGVPVEESVTELQRRLTRARSAQKEKETLQRQHQQESDALNQAQTSVATAKSRLDLMCREACCDSCAELSPAAERSTRRKQLETVIQQRDKELLAHSGGATIEEFVADASRFDPDSLGSELEQLEQQVALLREEMKQVDQIIGAEKERLQAMDGNGAAAEAADAAQNLLAVLQTDVPRYAALRLAAAILRRGIECYRQKHQSPIIELASDLFSRLTLGSFAGLKIDYDDAGEAVLKGVRPGGRQLLGVEAMSDGSCDQLYLALRLASLESWLETHEPIPFIVDDILLSFDNERAVAALEALSELAWRTQVIFFTHHRHLVELAEEHLPTREVFTCELERAALQGVGSSIARA